MKVELTAAALYRGKRFGPGDTPDVDAECAERWARKGWTAKPEAAPAKTEPEGSKSDDAPASASKSDEGEAKAEPRKSTRKRRR